MGFMIHAVYNSPVQLVDMHAETWSFIGIADFGNRIVEHAGSEMHVVGDFIPPFFLRYPRMSRFRCVGLGSLDTNLRECLV